MINPTSITNYSRTPEELEEFLMFAILVAGKKAKQTAKKLELFLNRRKTYGLPDATPFQFIRYLDKGGLLAHTMEFHKLGQYNRISKAFKQILQYEGRLDKVSITDLEKVEGIGNKTSRFFILHSRPNQNCAALDTHILRFLRDHGVSIPKSRPSGKKYEELEKKFLGYAKDYGVNPAELDLQVWTTYSKN